MQNATPLDDAARAFLAGGFASFTTPGHGRGTNADLFLALDAPLCAGADDLRGSRRLLEQAQDLAASAWGADWCRFIVNGSTQGNQALALAAASPGDRVLISRTVHKSLLAGLVLAGLDPVFLQPDLDAATGLPLRMPVARVRDALAANPGARAVFLTEPSYVGSFSDVAAIAAVTHAAGATLLVDGAWGAHFGFHPALPSHALALGADALVTSTHKTLPAFTQSAVLLARRGRIDLDRLDASFELLNTTSPSGSIYASIDRARSIMATRGAALLEVTIAQAERIRAALRAVPGIRLAATDDTTKVVALLAGTGADGFAVEAECELHGVRFEMVDASLLVPLLHVGTADEWVDRLVAVLPAAIERHRGTPRPFAVSAAFTVEPEAAMTPRDAFFAPRERVSAAAAAGRIAVETITPYPPGIPAIAPGEVIRREVLDALRAERAAGSRIAYCSDPALDTVLVAARRAEKT
jgi:lysine decarboxylase